jgi:hypothetical protein
MELTVLRNRFKPDYTAGQLYIDGTYFCFTLEDEVRDVKVKGETAIPEGYYDVTFEDSPHFGPQTLTINKVPNFSQIRIHSGNTEKDTDGCILVGWRINSSGVIVPGTSRSCLLELKKQVKMPCKIRVLNQPR